MEQKTKFTIIGLVIFTVVCLFLFIQTFGAKQDLMRERDELKTENSSLNTKVEKLSNALRSYENKIGSLNTQLDTVTQQKADIEQKFELVNKAREDLIQKISDLQASREKSPVRQEQEFAPQTNEAYWADVLRIKGELEMQLDSVRNELKSMQITNEQLQREKGGLELDLSGLKREKEDLQRQLDYNKKLMDSIAQELVREKNDKTQIQDTYKTIKNENAVLSRQLQSLNSRKINLDKNVQELQESKSALERRLSEMETMLTDRSSQIGELKQQIDAIKSGKAESVQADKKNSSVELPAIVVRPQANVINDRENPPGIGITGKVLAVNKENNFVVIDLGQDAGLKAGDAFKVYRGDRPVASIEAIQVRRSISACDIKKEASPIKIGDVVR